MAIERKQTLIAFEEMFVWSPTGNIGRHTFYKNNELAGYCGVLHALQLKGIDGHYGEQQKILIFSFGAVSRGAIYALKARGFKDITICIQRPDHEVREEVLDCHYVRIQKGKDNESRLMVVEHDGTKRPFLDLISKADIIVNGSFQEPDNPYMFINAEEASYLKPHSIIIDISCKDHSGLMRTLDPKQRKSLELFREYDVVTSKQLGDLFGFQPRTNAALCKKWVEGGFLEIVDQSFKSRKYSLAKKYKELLDI